jgi:phosphate transport system substrate-binding protein
MRCFISLLVAAMSLPVLGQDVPDLMERTRQVDEQIQQLNDQTPVAREMAELLERRQELEQQWREQSGALSEQINQLQQRPEWQAYEARLVELQQRRSEIAEAGRRGMAESARAIYETRHEQLRQIGRAELSAARGLDLDVLSYPRVDGSTSTHPLSVIVASRLLEVPYAWQYLETQGWLRLDPDAAGRMLPRDRLAPAPSSVRIDLGEQAELQLAASRVYADPGVGEDIRQQRIARMINSLLAAHTDTHQGYINLIDGNCDLNLTARRPSESERALAQEKGVEIVAVPVALDALVFLVNVDNPVESLTKEQLLDIYRDEIRNWAEVGGEAQPIRALRRARDSGSRELFDELMMKGEQLPEPADAWASDVYDTMGMMGPFSRITQEPNSLGYSVYYYEHFMAMSPRTRALAIDGVRPDAQTISSGEYPLATPVYVAYRAGEAADSPTMKLVQWLLSEEGQAVVRESGYVPVRAREE